MPKRNAAITVAIIGALAVILAAILGALLQPAWWRSGPHPTSDLVIAGTVVDEASNQAVSHATISVVGRTETYVTEDNGNFRIDLRGDAPKRVRLYVSKNGFHPLDTSVEPPVGNLILQLRKQ